MELFYRKIGNGSQSLIILHGLYGMSDNWLTVAQLLSEKFTLWIPDQRNHGRSPHINIHTYNEMSNDIYSFIKKHNIQSPFILGHSMGGKVALTFAKNYPNIISKLIVVDIAPVNYSQYGTYEITFHENIIESLLQLNLKLLKSRNEADILLSDSIKNQQIRAFLLKNLKRNNENEFYWLLNLPVLKKYLYHIIDGFGDWENNVNIQTPTLFIKGEFSSYIQNDFFPLIKKIFTNVTIKTITKSGHWVHSDKLESFIEKILTFTGI